MFQHTAARRRLVHNQNLLSLFWLVSTHSRPKAAGCIKFQRWVVCWCFNTQPPEGGWWSIFKNIIGFFLFQHTAARRRLARFASSVRKSKWFQHTAARRRLGKTMTRQYQACLFQHTAARRRLGQSYERRDASNCFNTQPPEGGWGLYRKCRDCGSVSTHSRPKAAGSA